MANIPYRYQHMPIGGGGYVTGLVFSEEREDILYARTDIGGIYRFDFHKDCWHSIMEPVGPDEIELEFPLAMALREHGDREPTLLFACGKWNEEEGLFVSTDDGGVHYAATSIPARVHGNRPGRGTGSRLCIGEDGNIYFASQSKGLLFSEDGGENWEAIDLNQYKYQRKGETNLTFVWAGCGSNARTLVIGSNGAVNVESRRTEDAVTYRERGHSLYVSYDGGITWEMLPEPEFPLLSESERSIRRQFDGKKDTELCENLLERERREIRGYVAQRYAYDGEWLYVTMNSSGDAGWCDLDGYSAEGGNPCKGRIVRYRFENNRLTQWQDVTPVEKTFRDTIPKGKGLFAKAQYKLDRQCYPFGFGGISTVKSRPGMVVCCTFGGMHGSTVLRSADGGKNWEVILHNLSIGSVQFNTSYMKPEYNSGRLLTHWMSDLKINPLRPDEAWFVTGTGVFRTQNLSDGTVVWSDCNVGLEETVHMNVYSLPVRHLPDLPVTEYTVNVIDAVGDLGGFHFTDMRRQCENTIADADGNRYITAMNADYPDAKPEYVIMTPRGNWTGETKGGVIVSRDGGNTWQSLPLPFGVSDVTDSLLEEITKPNRNSGWAAVSADGGSICWTLAEGQSLPSDAVVYTTDEGRNWQKSKVRQLPATKNPRLHLEQGDSSRTYLKVMADRTDSKRFFGFGNHFRIYISPDAGKNFYEYPVPKELPDIDLSRIERFQMEIRGETGKSGVFYIAAGRQGLWRMEYAKETDSLRFEQLHKDGEEFFCIGFGIGEGVRERNYAEGQKTLYTVGRLYGEDGMLHYGFYRSTDYGASWDCISNERQHFGNIRSIDGDKRIFGRYFIGSGNMGLWVGDEEA